MASLLLESLRGSGNKVVEHIQREILDGRLSKGDKLPTERQLAEEMGVSRASVREAMRALEAMQIVRPIQGSGNYITSSPETAVDIALCVLFALNDGTLNNIMQLRVMLEFEACRDAIQYSDSGQIGKIAKAADYDYENPDIPFQARMDRAFHAAIVRESRNPLLKYLYNSLAVLFDVYREKVFSATMERQENDITRQDHFAIAHALEMRDMDGVYSALDKHMYLNKDYLELLDLKYKNLR